MNRFSSFLQFCFVLVLTSAMGLVHAQELIRDSLAGPHQEVNRRAAENPYYNLRLGPVNVSFDASVALEYNDNIGIAERHRIDDLILTPRFGTSIFWPISELNSLNFNVGIGYSKYLLHGKGDSTTALISPGSALSFDMFVGDFRFNFHDRFSYTQDPIEQITLSNTTNFGVFNNEAGVAVDWDLNDLIISCGYDYVTDWHPQSQFTYLDADRHNLFARATLDLDPSFSLGLQGDISFTVYDSTRFQNNGAIYSFGPFYRWKLSEYLTWQSGGGITGGFFDRGGLNRDGQDPNGFYAYTQLLHKASEYFSHSLNLNRTTQFGLNTNFVEVTSARYNAAWKAFPSVTFNLQVFGEYAEESGRYGFAENAARYGAGVGVSRQLNDHLSVSASYNYVQKDSNLFLQDYYQNRVILELAYRF